MKQFILFAFTVVVCVAVSASVAFASDTLLVNGHIYTGNPAAKWAQASLISGNAYMGISAGTPHLQASISL